MSEWQTRPLGEICEIVNGGTPKTDVPKYWGGNNLWITPAEMGNRSDPYVSLTERTITDLGLNDSSARILPSYSVILSSRAPIGHLVINTKPMATNQGCKGLVPRDDLDHKFLYYYLSSIVDKLNALGTGTTFKELSGAKLKGVAVPSPPLSEQRRITRVLDDCLRGIEAAKGQAGRNRENAKAIFASYLQSVFSRRSSGWIEKDLRELCDIRHGFAFSGTDFSSDVPEGNPLVITPGNFTEDGKLLFNEKNTKRYRGDAPAAFQFDIGDLVVVMTDLSSKMKILGKPAFIDTRDVLHNQRIGRVVFLNDEIEKRLLYYFMMTEGFLRNIKSSATGTMVKHTAPTRILSNVMSFPRDRKEQRAIIEKLDAIRAETRRLAHLYDLRLAALEELRRSLLHRAFSGELFEHDGRAVVVPFPTRILGITATDLHAGVLATAYDLHDRNNRQQQFGHVKAEKIAHLVEAHIGIDLGRTPIKDAAGPNDYPHQLGVEHRARKAGYFDFKRLKGAGYRVKKLPQFDALIRRTREQLGDRYKEVDKLFELMLPMNTQQAEIFATVYSAWNNLLLDARRPTDEEIVLEARENWHPAKMRIPRDKFFKAIEWIREKGMVPSGKGRKVAAKAIQ